MTKEVLRWKQAQAVEITSNYSSTSTYNIHGCLDYLKILPQEDYRYLHTSHLVHLRPKGEGSSTTTGSANVEELKEIMGALQIKVVQPSCPAKKKKTVFLQLLPTFLSFLLGTRVLTFQPDCNSHMSICSRCLGCNHCLSV